MFQQPRQYRVIHGDVFPQVGFQTQLERSEQASDEHHSDLRTSVALGFIWSWLLHREALERDSRSCLQKVATP